MHGLHWPQNGQYVALNVIAIWTNNLENKWSTVQVWRANDTWPRFKLSYSPVSSSHLHDLAYVVLCYMVICKAPLKGGYSEALSAWHAGENKSPKETLPLQFLRLISVPVSARIHFISLALTVLGYSLSFVPWTNSLHCVIVLLLLSQVSCYETNCRHSLPVQLLFLYPFSNHCWQPTPVCTRHLHQQYWIQAKTQKNS